MRPGKTDTPRSLLCEEPSFEFLDPCLTWSACRGQEARELLLVRARREANGLTPVSSERNNTNLLGRMYPDCNSGV